MRTDFILSLLLFAGVLSACHKDKKPVIDTNSYYNDGDVSKFFYNNPNGVNVVVLGDGFVKADLAKGGNYDIKTQAVINYLFNVAPFAQYKQYFNTYVVYAQSSKSGAQHNGYDPNNTDTKFGSFFDTQITRLLEVGDYETLYKYVQYAVPLEKANLIIVVVNDDTYGGSGGPIAVASVESQSVTIMVHEIGHTFGGLGDEYVDVADSAVYSVNRVPFLPNIDNTKDSSKVKWNKFYKYHAYQGIVNAYEGAYFRPYGYYRPEESSIMLVLGPRNYNAPSREAIVRNIDTITNTPFDFNAFLKLDSPAIQPPYVTTINPAIPLPLHDFIGQQDGGKKLMEIRKHAKRYPQHVPIN